MWKKKENKLKNYQMAIESMELLTIKMEVIAREYFEANVDFISKIEDTDLHDKLVYSGGLSLYDSRFKNLLKALEDDTKLLKREKINLQFRKQLMTDCNQNLQ